MKAVIERLRRRAVGQLPRSPWRRRPMATPIHLVHLLHEMDLSGVASDVVNLCNTLSTKEFMVSCVCVRRRGRLAQRLEPRVQVWSLHAPDRGPVGLKTVRRATEMFHRYQVDLLHVHGADLGSWAPAAARLAGVSHVVVGEDRGARVQDNPTDAGHWTGRAIAPLARRSIDQLVAGSATEAEQMAPRFGVDPSRIQVLPRSVDMQKFRPAVDRNKTRQSLGFGPDHVVVGSVTRAGPGRPVADLIDAMAQMVAQGIDARLLVVGPGSDRPDLMERARTLGVADRATLFGYAPDVIAAMALLDIFVMPAADGGGISAALEAMATGVPVVAYDAQPLTEVVRADDTGLVVPPDDIQALTVTLAGLATDAGRRQQLAERGRQLAEQVHRMGRVVERYRKMVEGVTGAEIQRA